jgi:hypothetical protein
LHFPADLGRNGFVDVRLFREHLLQGALAERLAHGDLQSAVEVFVDVLQARTGHGGVRDFEHRRDVHSDDLVLGQDFLARTSTVWRRVSSTSMRGIAMVFQNP